MSLIRGRLWRGKSREQLPAESTPVRTDEMPGQALQVVSQEISADDPFLSYAIHAGVIELGRLSMESPTLERLKADGYQLTIPLVSRGELIGLLNLGPRLSQQDYSIEDIRLLTNLATQASSSLRLAQVARQQQIEAAQRERLEQELRVARVIQQTLLPAQLPQLDGWTMDAYWQPARAVSGDFYDFIPYEDGRLGIVIADVTDKGVPAALVMATTRSILRLAAEQLLSPGRILERANNLLVPDIPPNMFVTCLYLLLDPASGRIMFANAGHPLAYKRGAQGVDELVARGMPLGLMEGMAYEEMEAYVAPGESLLLYSDGLVEAHNPHADMFSSPRLKAAAAAAPCSAEMICCLVDELSRFTGPEWEQEDDVTIVTVERVAGPAAG